ncbi:sensor histidine kinase [Streptomyces sp. NPDC050704]|uniref:sensor histidine kinase n=1 Tax=Streptomyces sp. NPDC050704 TaxID=3157219 RepID=UPI00341AC890
MTGPADWRQTARAHPLVVDGMLAAAFFVISLLAPFTPGDPPQRVPLTAAVGVLAAPTCAALVLRRRWPLAVLAVTTGLACTAMVVTDVQGVFVVAPVVAAYTVAVRSGRRTAWTAGIAAAVTYGAAALAAAGGNWSDPGNSNVVVWIVAATAAGDAVRSRRAYVALLEERARRAEQSREEEAARRVVEERLRIARELHDVAAHHIAVISVQAGVAGHTLRTDPDVAEESLALVRQAGRSVLEELGALLSVLRRDDDPQAPVEPTRGLDGLDDLVGSFAAAGLEVAWTLSGRPRPLPSAVDLAAYRIVQESLTNVHKHSGTAAARVGIEYTPDRLVVRIRDEGHGGPAARTDAAHGGHGLGGHGMVGMRERASAVGGRFEAGPGPDGGFTVRAELPLPPASREGREGDDG